MRRFSFIKMAKERHEYSVEILAKEKKKQREFEDRSRLWVELENEWHEFAEMVGVFIGSAIMALVHMLIAIMVLLCIPYPKFLVRCFFYSCRVFRFAIIDTARVIHVYFRENYRLWKNPDKKLSEFKESLLVEKKK